jgi:hypothetical protein
MDVTGQLRVDDPAVDTPAGLGNNVFKDRGAIDRADFLGPTASLVNPQDNDAAGEDLNPAPSVVMITNPVVRSFDILLNDGLTETGRQAGTGVASASITRDAVVVLRDGELLEDGVDYIFSYDATGRLIRLTPLSGIWQPGRVYEIFLDNSESGIRDLADNRMQANQVSGQTMFTIAIGGEDQDFGDAPASYPVLLLDTGASHIIDPGFHLGSGVTAEPDGVPSENADADANDDGVTILDPLVPGNTSRIEIVASQAGKVDAWIDLNQDGDWNDSAERVLLSVDVTAGANVVNVAIPEISPEGVTFARFRLSRDGGLGPTGLAFNGEVEDYRVTLVSALPWTNEELPTDVNADGTVAPLDALLVINELNNRVYSNPQTGLLPNPPNPAHPPETEGFVDVDGDGFVSPRDALLVINRLNLPLGAAEGESDAGQAVAAVAATPSEHSGRLAAALYSAPTNERMEADVVDRLVETVAEPRSVRRLAEHGSPESLFVDPRIDLVDFDPVVDRLADDLAEHWNDDDLWMV